MPRPGAARRSLSAITFQGRLQQMLSFAQLLRREVRRDDICHDEAAFQARLAMPSNPCIGFLYLACRLRGTRSRHAAEGVLMNILAARVGPLARHCLRDAFAMYSLVHTIMCPRANKVAIDHIGV